MGDWELFEGWIEKRLLERTATRGEVYALRRLRRRDTPLIRRQLMHEYLSAVVLDPLDVAMGRLVETLRPLVAQMTALVLLFAEAEAEEFEHVDLGEFDNRAHDWMRIDGV